MNTNETRPDLNRLAEEHIRTPKLDDDIRKESFIAGHQDCWTTHVEPLQAKLEKAESENQKLREALKLQKEYTQFLSDYISTVAPYLRVHGMEASPELVNKGIEHRLKIEKSDQLLKLDKTNP